MPSAINKMITIMAINKAIAVLSVCDLRPFPTVFPLGGAIVPVGLVTFTVVGAAVVDVVDVVVVVVEVVVVVASVEVVVVVLVVVLLLPATPRANAATITSTAVRMMGADSGLLRASFIR